MPGYRGRGRVRYTNNPPKGRWMDLKYPGTCTAGEELPAGARAFWDPRDRSTTCTDLAHAEAAGLTRSVWSGSPTSGRWVETLTDTRLASAVGEGTPDPTKTYTRSLGGCSHEDYPCCGCDPNSGRRIA